MRALALAALLTLTGCAGWSPHIDDWRKCPPQLLALGIDDVDTAVTSETMNVLLKYQSDIDKTLAELDSGSEA